VDEGRHGRVRDRHKYFIEGQFYSDTITVGQRTFRFDGERTTVEK